VGIKPGCLPLGLGTFLSPCRPAGPLLPAPPASRPWARGRGSSARQWGPRGLGEGGPLGGPEGREGSRLCRGGAAARRASLPLPPAPQSLFLIRVTGAVPARLPSVCKRLTRGPSLNPSGAGLRLFPGAPRIWRLEIFAASRRSLKPVAFVGRMVTALPCLPASPVRVTNLPTNSLWHNPDPFMPALPGTPVRVFLPLPR
jgi:hypothetical protein